MKKGSGNGASFIKLISAIFFWIQIMLGAESGWAVWNFCVGQVSHDLASQYGAQRARFEA
jgi:hypothetical protein